MYLLIYYNKVTIEICRKNVYIRKSWWTPVKNFNLNVSMNEICHILNLPSLF